MSAVCGGWRFVNGVPDDPVEYVQELFDGEVGTLTGDLDGADLVK